MSDQQAQFILALAAYVTTRGANSYQVCNDAGIDLDLLVNKTHGPIDSQQILALWKAAEKHCEDKLFGLHFGESLQLAALGAVGEIVKSSRTIGDAVTIAASLVPMVTDLFTMSVTKADSSFTTSLYATNIPRDPEVEKHVADFLMVFTIHELDGFCLKRICPIEVSCFFRENEEHEFVRVFRTGNIKQSKQYTLHFSKALWDQPIITANHELQKVLLQKITEERRTDYAAESFQTKVINFLRQNSYLGILSLDDVAANFNMTPRSLQRRLQEESVTFQQLADSVRKSLALYYLQSGKYQIKEISNMLGYNELSAFSRAFKRWTGKPPVNYAA